MKTILEFKDGRIEEADDAAPMAQFDADDGPVLCLVDEDMAANWDDIPLSDLKRVIFEP